MAREEQVQTRENSTLVVSTVAASASLAILAVVLQDSDLLRDYSWIKGVGLIFSFLGPLYRESTIFTIDHIDYRETRKREYPWWAVIPRMIILRLLLFLPIAAWTTLFAPSTCQMITMMITLVVAVLFSVIFSVVEWQDRKCIRREVEAPQPSCT